MKVYVAILLISLVSVGFSNIAKQPLEELLDYENCHKTEPSCVYDKMSAAGNRIRSCWLRCVCSGFSTGVCQESSRCLPSGKPWECKCRMKQEIHIMQALCGYGQQEWV